MKKAILNHIIWPSLVQNVFQTAKHCTGNCIALKTCKAGGVEAAGFWGDDVMMIESS